MKYKIEHYSKHISSIIKTPFDEVLNLYAKGGWDLLYTFYEGDHYTFEFCKEIGEDEDILNEKVVLSKYEYKTRSKTLISLTPHILNKILDDFAKERWILISTFCNSPFYTFFFRREILNEKRL